MKPNALADDSRERLQLVLDLTDSSRDSLFIFDTRSRELLHMNQATYADLGYRVIELPLASVEARADFVMERLRA